MTTMSFCGMSASDFKDIPDTALFNKVVGQTIFTGCKVLIAKHQIDTFIFDGRLGTSQVAFSAIKALKQHYYPNIKMVIAIPYVQQYLKWTKEEQGLYREQLAFADETVLVDCIPEYQTDGVPDGVLHLLKYENLAKYMLQRSDYLYAVYDGNSTGYVRDVIDMASKNGKRVFGFVPSFKIGESR